jgi:hypothetical protein
MILDEFILYSLLPTPTSWSNPFYRYQQCDSFFESERFVMIFSYISTILELHTVLDEVALCELIIQLSGWIMMLRCPFKT